MIKRIMLLTAMAVIIPTCYAMASEGGDQPKRHGQMGEKLFDRADENGDGVISKREFVISAEKKFDMMDGNGDGELTKEEAREHRKQMKERFKDGKGKRDRLKNKNVDDVPQD